MCQQNKEKLWDPADEVLDSIPSWITEFFFYHGHKIYHFPFHWHIFRYPGQSVRIKPVAIADYNQHMLGVDTLDQLSSYYPFLRKTLKWWKKVMFWSIEVAVINSYVVYKQDRHGDKLMTHLEFRRELVVQLSQPLCSIPRSHRGHHSDQSLERLHAGNHFIERGANR